MAKPPKKTFKGDRKPEQKRNPGGKHEPRGHKTARKGEAARFDSPRREDRPRKEMTRNAPQRKEFAKSPRIRADLFGFHAVRAAWQNTARFVHALYITESALKEFEADLKIPSPNPSPQGEGKIKRPAPTIVSKDDLDRAFPPGTVHQGIALSAQALEEISLIDIIIAAKDKPKSLIVVLDQVTDPHNVGAIMRSACAFGADGIVMQSRHAPESVGILAKTACGAVEHLPCAYETNLSRAIETLKEHHYTIIGMDEHAQKSFGDLPRFERAAIVLGAEGPGMRRLIKEHCDILVTLPTRPPIASLNVSNAAAVALYALTS